MARSLVMGNGNDSLNALTAQRMQNQRLPGHVVRSTRFPGEAPQRGALAGNGLQCQSCRSERQRSDRRSSDGEARENPLRAGERETSATGGVHGRAQLDGLQHVAEYRTFGVDVHTSSLERWTKSADRLHQGITRLVPPRHLDRPKHARSHGPQTCMRRIEEENLMWIQAQVHEETAKSSKLATGRQLDGEGQRNTERRWTGKLEGMGREGQRNCTRKSQRHNEKKGSISSAPDGSIQSIFRHQSRRTKAFEQANMASQETSQAGSHRADHPDSCSCRQSSSRAKAKPAREMGQAVGGERVLARRTPLRILQRALWRARSSQDSGSRSKSFGYHKEDEVQKEGTSGIDATGFATALKKLKKGKNSPDGLTAEVLQNLLLEQRSRLSTEVTRRMCTLELPEEWFESTAALAPKTAGANTLAKYRPIACLSTTRKIFGYMFLSSHPQLDFRSRQTAFVKGCHANMGAHMYLRIGELSREWNLECNAAQLDVRKAFDHVCHAAALRAMEEMGVGNHSRALIAKAWSLSKVRARLAKKTSQPVPQGAPESPIIFAMILECVVRRCEKTGVSG